MKYIRKYDLAIIGGGAAGLSTATHVKRCRDLSIIVISRMLTYRTVNVGYLSNCQAKYMILILLLSKLLTSLIRWG